MNATSPRVFNCLQVVLIICRLSALHRGFWLVGKVAGLSISSFDARHIVYVRILSFRDYQFQLYIIVLIANFSVDRFIIHEKQITFDSFTFLDGLQLF